MFKKARSSPAIAVGDPSQANMASLMDYEFLIGVLGAWASISLRVTTLRPRGDHVQNICVQLNVFSPAALEHDYCALKFLHNEYLNDRADSRIIDLGVRTWHLARKLD